MDHYGLIGNPVSHSLSEKYFTDKFTLQGIDARFERFLLNDIHALPQILDAYPHLIGLSVTSPFKESVIPYCSSLDDTASKVGAVNTIKIHRTGDRYQLKGYNTDVDGFAAAIIPIIGKEKPDALILGSGGAARAVAYALSRLGLSYQVVSRKATGGKIGYSELNTSIIKSHRLIINATPLGMANYKDQAPAIPYHLLSASHILFDLIYNPAESAFLRRGKQSDSKCVNGLLMLQAQAERAWMIWTEQ
jgi:shikimate dehydrogenase